MKKALIPALLLIPLFGCFDMADSKKSQEPNFPVKSSEEALARLSPQHRQDFQKWQGQIVKTCDASQAFGLAEQDPIESDGVDGIALLKANHHSVLFSDEEGFVLLSSYQTQSGISRTEVKNSFEINGKRYSLEAEAKRDGSTCTVYLYGQKVFETYILENFEVGSEWTHRQATVSTKSSPEIVRLGISALSELRSEGLLDLLHESFAPSKRAWDLLSHQLGISKKQVSRLFKLKGSSTPMSARVDGDVFALWTKASDGRFLAHEGTLEKIMRPGSQKFALDLRASLPQFSFLKVQNDQDKGQLKFLAEVSLVERDRHFHFSTRSVNVLGVAPWNRQEAVKCAGDRALAYLRVSRPLYKIEPTVEFMLGPCYNHYPEVEIAAYKSGLMQTLVPQIFHSVTPSALLHYGGWDDVVGKLALEILDQEGNLVSELDPQGLSSLIPLLAHHLNPLNESLARAQNLQAHRELVLGMGLSWSFAGHDQAATESAHIVQSLDHALKPFEASTLRLLQDLRLRPSAHTTALDFAAALTPAHKAEALQALSAAKVLGYSDFQVQVFNLTLQNQVSEAEFRSWTDRLNSLSKLSQNRPKLSPLSNQLVPLSLQWLKSQELSMQELDEIYEALNRSMDPFVASTKAWLREMELQGPQDRTTLTYIQSLKPEHKKRALSILKSTQALDQASWGESLIDNFLQQQPSLQQLRSWDTMWTEALVFTKREQRRTKKEPGTWNEWNRKKILDVAVNENWSRMEFTGLETIAKLAQLKGGCERHPGASSLADCVGLELFSKNEGMFFDPRFGHRYGPLAKEFVSYISQLSDFEGASLKFQLIQKFFDRSEILWSSCGKTAFANKTKSLKNQFRKLFNTHATLGRWEIESQIQETLRPCR